MTGEDLAVLQQLTVREKALLSAGLDMWTVPGVKRLGIEPLTMTDGPNGVRGNGMPGEATPATCIPCGAAVGATWDPDLARRLGSLLGTQARAIGARVLLAPTVNLPRSPLWGRSFECYSEDPLLSGLLAAGFVRGTQAQGVMATVKHLVANETEHERMTISSEVDPRTLRELYLLPFELAIREGGALGVMTSYNRLNGSYCSEDKHLLSDVLRGEWGFEGLVMTDWWAVGATVTSARAGLDIQMPGPGRWYGEALADAVEAGSVSPEVLDASVRRRLHVQRTLTSRELGGMEDPSALSREAAAAGSVLLTNRGVLPLHAASLKRLAVIGPNADRAVIMGGGSAGMNPEHRTSPLAALRTALPAHIDISYAQGCVIDKLLPMAELDLTVEFYSTSDLSGPVAHKAQHNDGALLYLHQTPAETVPFDSFSFRATGTLTPTESGQHTLSVVQCGQARVSVDGHVVLDGWSSAVPRDDAFYGFGSEELHAEVALTAGVAVEILVEWIPGDATALKGLRLGHRGPMNPHLMDEAVAAARAADVVVLVVGTDGDWESEGYDRDDLNLPGDQDELVCRVIAANPQTVVVVNAGAPVALDWARDAGAILQVWFGGQEMAAALADVILGDVEPGGRLPVTMPLKLEHGPSYGSFPGDNGRTPYREGLLAGYRWYDTRQLPVSFPFGHGLSYTTFEIGPPRAEHEAEAGCALRIDVEVTNTGDRPGSEVVQVYVQPLETRVARPHKELKAFRKVHLDPRQSRTITLELGPRAFAYWDDAEPDRAELQARLDRTRPDALEGSWEKPGWRVDPGRYVVHVARSAERTDHHHVVELTGNSCRVPFTA